MSCLPWKRSDTGCTKGRRSGRPVDMSLPGETASRPRSRNGTAATPIHSQQEPKARTGLTFVSSLVYCGSPPAPCAPLLWHAQKLEGCPAICCGRLPGEPLPVSGQLDAEGFQHLLLFWCLCGAAAWTHLLEPHSCDDDRHCCHSSCANSQGMPRLSTCDGELSTGPARLSQFSKPGMPWLLMPLTSARSDRAGSPWDPDSGRFSNGVPGRFSSRSGRCGAADCASHSSRRT